jgi:hypothetical protein
MSRLNRLSASAIRAMFASETDEQLIMLLTIEDPDTTGGAYNLYLADGFTNRLSSTTDQEVVYGVTSNSQEYTFIPMEITLPPEQDSGVGQCNITINYVTQEAITLIRTHLTKPALANIKLVLASSPNTIEAEFPKFYITSANYSSDSIKLELNMINYSLEPFPAYSFTPRYFPGLF